jgi:hypothetical protein
MVAARLAWRMQRWESLVLVGGSLLFAALMALVAWQTTSTVESLGACYDASGGQLSSQCRSLIDWGNLVTAIGAPLPIVATGIPFVAGVLLGAPLVAREVEKRTAAIAWPLSRSRRGWLVGRVAPTALAVAAALLAVGAASEALLNATRETEPGFLDFGAHGPLIAARGLAVLSVGVLVGMVVGRVLPAVLVTGLVTAALFTGLQLGRDQMMRTEAAWVAVPENGGLLAMIYDQAWTDDVTGELVTYDEAIARFPDVFGPTGSWMPPGMTPAYLTTPPEQYPIFVAREIGTLLVFAVVAGTLSAWVVGWRRPG